MDYETAFQAVTERVPAGALAAALKESPQTVSNWKTRGIPANRCKAVEALTGVSVRELRPNDWADYWPEC